MKTTFAEADGDRGTVCTREVAGGVRGIRCVPLGGWDVLVRVLGPKTSDTAGVGGGEGRERVGSTSVCDGFSAFGGGGVGE